MSQQTTAARSAIPIVLVGLVSGATILPMIVALFFAVSTDPNAWYAVALSLVVMVAGMSGFYGLRQRDISLWSLVISVVGGSALGLILASGVFGLFFKMGPFM